LSLDVQPTELMEEEPNLEPTMLDSEQAADEESSGEPTDSTAHRAEPVPALERLSSSIAPSRC
jgi:hypothetical protein